MMWEHHHHFQDAVSKWQVKRPFPCEIDQHALVQESVQESFVQRSN